MVTLSTYILQHGRQPAYEVLPSLSRGCVDGHWSSKEAKCGVAKVGNALITQLEVGIVCLTYIHTHIHTYIHTYIYTYMAKWND